MNAPRRLLMIGVSLATMLALSHFVRRPPGSRAADGPPNTEFNEVYNKFVAHGKIEADMNDEWQRRYRGLRVTWSGRFVKNHYAKTYLKNIGVESPNASVVTMLPSLKAMSEVALSAGRRVVYSATLDSYDVERGLLKVRDFTLLKIEEPGKQ